MTSEVFERGIDISHWNVVTDFNAIKKAGYSFVIIKAGGSDKGFYKDSKFEEYYQGAKNAGLKVGCYYFVGKKFWGEVSGKADAERFLNIIGGKSFDYPVCLDVESLDRKYKKEITEATLAFTSYLECRGYFVSIYGSDLSTFADLVDINKLTAIDKWVARYGSKPKYVKEYGIHQKSSTGRVDGIKGNVDIDDSYRDYARIIRKAKLNGVK